MSTVELTPAQRLEHPAALATMQEVMTRPSFTFLEVHSAGDRIVGTSGACYRWADGLLQKARKAGTIKWSDKVWSAV